MSNLKLITTEKFGDLDCNFYRNMNDDILLTREQIGTALEYADPSKAIRKLHLKHNDRLEPLCLRLKLSGHPQIGANLTKSEEQTCVYYTQRGVMEICRWSRQPKANQFMDWVWDITEKYRSGELQPQINSQSLTDVIAAFTTTISTMTENMKTIQTDLSELKQKQHKRYLSANHYPSAWYKKITPKYKLLQDYFGCTRSELYSSIYKELEDTYSMDINEILEDYCFENNLSIDDVYPMEAIEHNTKLRDALTLLINNSLVKYGLQTEEQVKNYKRTTLFDMEPVKKENINIETN